MAVTRVQGARPGHELRGRPEGRGQGLEGRARQDRGLEQWSPWYPGHRGDLGSQSSHTGRGTESCSGLFELGTPYHSRVSEKERVNIWNLLAVEAAHSMKLHL